MSRSRPLSIRDIQAAVAAAYGISVEELVSAGRTARVAWPRQVAIHLSRNLTNVSLSAVGEAFGGRNHATVLHACKRVSERIRTDPEAAGEVDHLVGSLTTSGSDRFR
jgi:chromosomal replication initiator protein